MSEGQIEMLHSGVYENMSKRDDGARQHDDNSCVFITNNNRPQSLHIDEYSPISYIYT